jgi:clan AA aspartic protease
MISGLVNAHRDAIIEIAVLGPGGQRQMIEAVVDTGFNGFLTLPIQTIDALSLPRAGRVRVLLGDGREDFLPMYRATVSWDGSLRLVDVDAAESDALVGMALLDGYELRIQVAEGGAVTIEAMA